MGCLRYEEQFAARSSGVRTSSYTLERLHVFGFAWQRMRRRDGSSCTLATGRLLVLPRCSVAQRRASYANLYGDVPSSVFVALAIGA